MSYRNRFGQATSGTPLNLNQRLVDNDYLSNRDYQSTQPQPAYMGSVLSQSAYTPPAPLATDSTYDASLPSYDAINKHYYDPHALLSALNLNQQHKYPLPLPYQEYLYCFSHGLMCCQCVRTNELGVLENWGRFTSILGPGFHCIPMWPWTRIASRLSLVRFVFVFFLFLID